LNRSTVSTVAIVIFALLPACASTGTVHAKESSADYVTTIEISKTPATTAYDLVSRLRPNWLRQGSVGSVGGGRISGQVTLVYLDGNRVGGIDALRNISANGIATMEWLDAARAETILRGIGTEPIAGVIVLKTATQ
jgi:hypothetical protein